MGCFIDMTNGIARGVAGDEGNLGTGWPKYDFRGRWSATPTNRGQSIKTQGRTALKSGGGSLAMGAYIQRGSAPLPLWY